MMENKLSDLRFTDFADPSVICRELQVDRLRERAQRLSDAYAAQPTCMRSRNDAIQMGACRGAALARQYLGVVALPTEILFESSLDQRPRPYRGTIPYIVEASASAYEVVIMPRLTAMLQAAASLALKPVLRQIRRPTDRIDKEAALVADLVALFLTQRPASLISPLGAGALLGSQWLAAGVKLLQVTPAAGIGAALGAAYHDWIGCRTWPAPAAFAASARNEETFALLEPVTAIPRPCFFLTEDRFGLDVRELRMFVRSSGRAINPHTNVAFSPADQKYLRRHPLQPLTPDKAPTQRLSGTMPSAPHLWVTYWLFFLELSRALTEDEGRNAPLRRQAAHAMVRAVGEADPVHSLWLRLLFESIGVGSYAKLVEGVRARSADAYELGLRLFSASQTVGYAVLLAQTNRVRAASVPSAPQQFLDTLLQRAQAITDLHHISTQYVLEQTRRRFPWLQPFEVTSRSYPSAQQLGPVDLATPPPPSYPLHTDWGRPLEFWNSDALGQVYMQMETG